MHHMDSWSQPEVTSQPLARPMYDTPEHARLSHQDPKLGAVRVWWSTQPAFDWKQYDSGLVTIATRGSQVTARVVTKGSVLYEPLSL